MVRMDRASEGYETTSRVLRRHLVSKSEFLPSITLEMVYHVALIRSLPGEPKERREEELVKFHTVLVVCGASLTSGKVQAHRLKRKTGS